MSIRADLFYGAGNPIVKIRTKFDVVQKVESCMAV
jgi:hypothetical protein